MIITIEKGIAPPSGVAYDDTLRAMEVNDSFAIPASYAPNVRQAIHRAHKRPKSTAKFVSRKIDGGRIRVWRIA